MTMARKEGNGDYQIGIYRVTRLLGSFQGLPWVIEDRDGHLLHGFHTLRDAYYWCMGELVRRVNWKHED